MTLARIAEQTGLDRAVVRRLMNTLVAQGFARHHDKKFELTNRVLRVAYSFLTSAGLGPSLQPLLDRFAAELQETISVAVLEGAEAVFVARSDVPGRRLSFVTSMGMRLPAFTAASGRMLLAHEPPDEVVSHFLQTRIVRHTRHTIMRRQEIMDEIEASRARGYAVSDEELEDGVVGIAVPITNSLGFVVASLNASVAHARDWQERRTHIVDTLADMAKEIGQMLP